MSCVRVCVCVCVCRKLISIFGEYNIQCVDRENFQVVSIFYLYILEGMFHYTKCCIIHIIYFDPPLRKYIERLIDSTNIISI